MKKFLIALAVVVLMATSAMADGVLTASVGAYVPSSDLDDVGIDSGTMTALTYATGILPFTDLQLNYANYTASGNLSGSDNEVDTTGYEIMAVVSLPLVLFDPYVGVGYGFYDSDLKVGGSSFSESGDGMVVQAGLRFNFVIVTGGLYVKQFENKIEDADLGGTIVALEAGLKF